MCTATMNGRCFATVHAISASCHICTVINFEPESFAGNLTATATGDANETETETETAPMDVTAHEPTSNRTARTPSETENETETDMANGSETGTENGTEPGKGTDSMRETETVPGAAATAEKNAENPENE